jgi:glycosyltransferase involved in cell wall biosynthesis
VLLYPSEWVARSAIDHYGADPGRVHVIPYGANLDEVPPREAATGRRPGERCRLLFLALEWERKGGDIAFATLLELEEVGIRAELVVCGATPPAAIRHERLVVLGRLDKNDPAQLERLVDLLATSDFLLRPTRAECYGIVFCEAAAFGLPVITTATGGVTTIVRHGENGLALPLDAGPQDYAAAIARLHGDPDAYTAMAVAGRLAYEERLNWGSWAEQVLTHLAAL